MDKAYSLFELKSMNEEERSFEGIATTPQVDRTEDIVEPMGAEFTLPLPMLWQHGKGSIPDPIGQITEARVTSSGIRIKGQMLKPGADYPQQLRDDLNKAWVLVRDKVVRGLSIGFKPLESEPIKGSYGMRFTKWSWLELSPVAIPANAGATIQTIKSYDMERASSGEPVHRVVRLPSPGVTGKSKAGVVRLPQHDEETK